jgi:transposase
MKKPLPDIHEEASMLKQRMHQEKDARKTQRLHALYLAKSGQLTTRQEIAAYLGVHRNTVSRWFTSYASSGLEELLTITQPTPPTGQRSLPQVALDGLKQKLSTPEGWRSYGAIQRWLAEEYGLQINYFTLYRIVRRDLKAKLKVPRQSHGKKTP